ncbi:hypothetical protein [Planococcus sp. CAU13]|uniref:hypothetical protein n=1 Tax=Planococcus sp. CAU13 TaxID=1541197 RepID=UPI000B0B0C7A|nr:hypothetical protein [Planococcus sp. CAU13]
MKKLLSIVNVTSENGVYRFYQYRDKNPLPQIELYKLSGEKNRCSNCLWRSKEIE